MARKERQKKVPGDMVLNNPKHELFCWLYAGYHNRDLFGNGTRSYMQAYGMNTRINKINDEISKLSKRKDRGYTAEISTLQLQIKSIENGARAMAAEVLAKPNIRHRVDYLIDSYIGNDFTDRELQYVILQRFDLNSKVQAIKEFNRLKDRGSSGKLEGNFTFSWEGEDEITTRKKEIKKKALKAEEKEAVEWEE